MRSIPLALGFAALGIGAALLVAAAPGSGAPRGALFAAFGDLEVPVIAVGHVPTGPTRGPVVITLALAELPLDHLAGPIDPPTSRGGASASAGSASSVVAPDAAGTASRTARTAVEVVRRFRPLDRFDMWLALDEQTITDRLSCLRPKILGAQGVGRTVLQVHCASLTITDRPGGAVFPHWVTDTAGVPPAPAGLEFTPGGTILSAAAIERLRLLLALLAKHQDLSLFIAGFAEVGDGAPVTIGAQRAAAVRDYFVNNGIARNRLTTASYGAEKPLGPDDTDQAWSHNRRAQLTILSGAQQ